MKPTLLKSSRVSMFMMSIPTWMSVGAGEAPFGPRCPHMIQRGGGVSFILIPQKYGSGVPFISLGASGFPWEGPPSQKHEFLSAADELSAVFMCVPLIGSVLCSSHEASE